MKKTILITGTENSTGLGRAMMDAFRAEPLGRVFTFGIDKDWDDGRDYVHYVCDITKENEVYTLSENLTAAGIDEIDVLINNAGVNHINPMEEILECNWDKVMDTNAKSIWLLAKHLLKKIKKAKGTILNVVSNAAWIPMTHSVAYNASKSAAAIMTRQMARELKGEVCVFGICPNKLEGTGMSRYIESRVPDLRGWTPEEAQKYQLNALLSGMETKVEWIAELVHFLLSKPERHKYLTGCLLPLGL